MKKGTQILLIIVVILIVAGGSAFFILTPKIGADTTNEQTKDLKLPVKVVPAARGRLRNYIKLNGDVAASSTVDVMPDVAGKLTAVNVQLGNYVVKDQILALVDPSRPGATFVASPVKAPISGTITRVIGSLGKTVSPAMPVMQIGQLYNLEVVTYVSERYISYIKKGQKAMVRVQALPDQALSAFVTEISPVVNIRTRTMETTLAISGNSQYLKAGMLASITLIIEELTDVIRIPEEAIIHQDEVQKVFVVGAEEKAEERIIKTGLIIDDYAEVTTGLTAGEKVVLSGKALISIGSELRIIETMEPLAPEGNIGGFK